MGPLEGVLRTVASLSACSSSTSPTTSSPSLARSTKGRTVSITLYGASSSRMSMITEGFWLEAVFFSPRLAPLSPFEPSEKFTETRIFSPDV